MTNLACSGWFNGWGIDSLIIWGEQVYTQNQVIFDKVFFLGKVSAYIGLALLLLAVLIGGLMGGITGYLENRASQQPYPEV